MPSTSRSSGSASAPTADGSFRARTPMEWRVLTISGAWVRGNWACGSIQDRYANASHPPAFTSDGRLMALGIARDQVLLADAATGRELARLTTLQPVNPDAAGLQPRRHEAGRLDRPEDRAPVGPAADPRPARADGTGLGRIALSDRVGARRRLAQCRRRRSVRVSAKSSSPRRGVRPNWPK